MDWEGFWKIGVGSVADTNIRGLRQSWYEGYIMRSFTKLQLLLYRLNVESGLISNPHPVSRPASQCSTLSFSCL